MPRTVLIVDDASETRARLAAMLETEGFNVSEAADGRDALKIVRSSRIDMIVLELVLPGLSGLDICRILRAESDIPILVLTSRNAEIDKIVGLELGADDYVTKPFSAREVLARIRALFRRSEARARRAAAQPIAPYVDDAPGVQLGRVRVDLKGHRMTRDGVTLHVRPRTFQLLAFLLRNPGQVFTREQLVERVWGYDYAGEARTVNVHICWLRAHIEDDPARPVFLQTIRGVGYVLRAPELPESDEAAGERHAPAARTSHHLPPTRVAIDRRPATHPERVTVLRG